jgi:hypothetical protein
MNPPDWFMGYVLPVLTILWWIGIGLVLRYVK